MLPLTDTVTQTDCYVQRIVIMGVASIASSVAYKKATGIVSDVEGRRRTDYFALALLRRLWAVHWMLHSICVFSSISLRASQLYV